MTPVSIQRWIISARTVTTCTKRQTYISSAGRIALVPAISSDACRPSYQKKIDILIWPRSLGGDSICTVLYRVQYCTTLYSTLKYLLQFILSYLMYTILLLCIVFHRTVLYGTVLYCVVLYIKVKYCKVLYFVLLYSHCRVKFRFCKMIQINFVICVCRYIHSRKSINIFFLRKLK